MTSCQVEELKEKGNVCVREGKFEEAMLHYSHAIKLDPKNYTLYSNRSLAFLRMNQFYFALKDAKETIRLNPYWAKGYFRLGEVQRCTYQFVDALLSYRSALELQPNDSMIIEALTKTAHENRKERKADIQIPWLGAGLGIILGVAIVISDYAFTQSPSLSEKKQKEVLMMSSMILVDLRVIYQTITQQLEIIVDLIDTQRHRLDLGIKKVAAK
ncbi:hsp70-Hsp90 organising protein-like isoform X2 [Lycorma delicatula]|uniref:hsp70-Hsp90 organising protein-like isoform X2 n=1 Tax=Lycorma delicatula TaxID=130591 RepID=UPI003F514FFD